MSRKIMILALLAILTGLGLLTNCVRQKNEEAVKKSAKQERRIPKKPSESIEESNDNKLGVVEQSKKTLEKSDSPVSETEYDQTKSDVEKAIAYINSVEIEDFGKLEGSYDNRLSLTSLEMLNELASMLMTGYQYDNDSLEVFKSHADNVYQIVLTVSKSETDRLSFAGNYVPATHQIELTSMKGTPTRSTVKMEERTFYD